MKKFLLQAISTMSVLLLLSRAEISVIAASNEEIVDEVTAIVVEQLKEDISVMYEIQEENYTRVRLLKEEENLLCIDIDMSFKVSNMQVLPYDQPKIKGMCARLGIDIEEVRILDEAGIIKLIEDAGFAKAEKIERKFNQYVEAAGWYAKSESDWNFSFYVEAEIKDGVLIGTEIYEAETKRPYEWGDLSNQGYEYGYNIMDIYIQKLAETEDEENEKGATQIAEPSVNDSTEINTGEEVIAVKKKYSSRILICLCPVVAIVVFIISYKLASKKSK